MGGRCGESLTNSLHTPLLEAECGMEIETEGVMPAYQLNISSHSSVIGQEVTSDGRRQTRPPEEVGVSCGSIVGKRTPLNLDPLTNVYNLVRQT